MPMLINSPQHLIDTSIDSSPHASRRPRLLQEQGQLRPVSTPCVEVYLAPGKMHLQGSRYISRWFQSSCLIREQRSLCTEAALPCNEPAAAAQALGALRCTGCRARLGEMGNPFLALSEGLCNILLIGTSISVKIWLKACQEFSPPLPQLTHSPFLPSTSNPW